MAAVKTNVIRILDKEKIQYTCASYEVHSGAFYAKESSIERISCVKAIEIEYLAYLGALNRVEPRITRL